MTARLIGGHCQAETIPPRYRDVTYQPSFSLPFVISKQQFPPPFRGENGQLTVAGLVILLQSPCQGRSSPTVPTFPLRKSQDPRITPDR